MTNTPTQQQTIANMIDICTAKVAAVKTAQALGYNGKFYLVIKDGQMVMVEGEGGIFRLNGSDASSGYQFETFGRAMKAAKRWNAALTPAQRQAGCLVTAVSHAQYLEYIEVACTRLINTLSGHAVKN